MDEVATICMPVLPPVHTTPAKSPALVVRNCHSGQLDTVLRSAQLLYQHGLLIPVKFQSENRNEVIASQFLITFTTRAPESAAKGFDMSKFVNRNGPSQFVASCIPGPSMLRVCVGMFITPALLIKTQMGFSR
jgi:hypothetical protein